MKKILTGSIFILITTLMWANINLIIEVEQPKLGVRGIESSYPLMSKPDEPMLPFIPLRILLPQGHRITRLSIDTDETRAAYSDVEIQPAGRQIPISEVHRLYDTGQEKDGDISSPQAAFNVSGIYPDKTHQSFGVSRKNGYDILLLNLYPYQYDIDNAVLYSYKRFSIEVETHYSGSYFIEQNRFLITNEKVKESIRRLVINPDMVERYTKTPSHINSLLPDISDPSEIVIITQQSKTPLFDEFIQHKINNGLLTALFTTEEIYANYTGNDQQEQIRNFIIDAYRTYADTETPLRYVIIGGDDSIVPVRGMYCFVKGLWNDYEDYHIPSDVYYSNLDGNWDANNNQIYGELDDGIDWFSEIHIGRIPAITDSDFRNFFHKTIHYSSVSSYSNDISLMIGQKLDNVTWGADYMEEIVQKMPAEFRLTKYYEKDGSYNPASIIRDIKNGLGILNHLGHSNQSRVFGVGGSGASDLDNNEFGLAYSQGCLTCAFDYHTTQEADAIGQKLVNVEGGFFTFIGNTRYGWYWPESTRGASQLYHLAFIDGLFKEGLKIIGEAHTYSKETLVNEALENSFQDHLWDNGFMVWAFYTQILFGDPAISLRNASNNFPYLVPIAVTYDDYYGDNDGIINPGETVNLFIEIENAEDWADAHSIQGTISTDNHLLKIIREETSFPSVLSGEKVINTVPFTIAVDQSIGYGEIPLDLHITAAGKGADLYRKSFAVSFPVSLLQKNFPWRSDLSYAFYSAPVVMNDKITGQPLIIAADLAGNIHFTNSKGEKVFDTINASIGNMMRSISIGDINNDGNDEIVLTSRIGNIKAINTTGEVAVSFQVDDQFLHTPILTDLTGDDNLEIISLSLNKELYAIDHTGIVIEGFPLTLQAASIAEPAAGDINNNGYAEIVIGLINGELHIIDKNSHSLPNFPVQLGAQITVSPIIIDNNRIVAGTSANKIFIINNRGEILLEKHLAGRVISEPAAADFNEDGTLEIICVTANGSVYLFDQAGNDFPGFPVNLEQVITQPPLIADINGNGSLNIVIATNSGDIYGFNPDGTYAELLPAPLPFPPSSPLFIADIDLDGDYEIGYGTNNGIVCIDYKLPAGKDTPWSVYRGNFQRTGNYGDNDIYYNIPVPEHTTSLKQNFPNPFNSKTTLSFTINESQYVRLDIYNIKGQKVKTVFDNVADLGETQVKWGGNNDENKAVASGVYLYKMRIDNTTYVRKMLLLK